MANNMSAAFFVVSLVAPMLALGAGVVFLAWPSHRVARTAGQRKQVGKAA